MVYLALSLLKPRGAFARVRDVSLWAYGVVVSMFDFQCSDRGSNPGRGGEKFPNVYDYTIERYPWQVSENHKPLVHPSHVREIG